MRIRLVGLLLIAVAEHADAQIIRSRFQLSQPTTWVSLGAGYQQGWTVQDATGTWELADGPQYVASIEKTISTGVSFGIAATTALVPVRVGTLDYDTNVSQGFGTLHVANGGAFHTAFDFRAGTTYYAPFTVRNCTTCTGLVAPNAQGDFDFSFGLGYGFGYAFSPRFSIDVTQDITTSVHQRDPSNPGGNASSRISSTRFAGRFGLGGR